MPNPVNRFRPIPQKMAKAGLLLLLAVVASFGAAVAVHSQPGPVTVPNIRDPAARTLRPAPGVVPGIRFVTTADYPPFNFTDAADRLTGFNIDLARAVCAELSVPCTIQARPFEDLAPSVLEGRADAVIAGLAISPATRTTLAFSDVYLPLPARFATRNGLPLEISPESLARRRVSVAAGSAHLAYLEAYFPGVDAQPYPTPEAARAALRSGQADATFGDGVQLAFWLQGTTASGCCAFAGGLYLDSAFFGEGFAIALRPADRDLRTAINAALAALEADGIFAELYLRYFPLGYF